MASLYDSASLVMIPSGYKEDKIYSIKPTDGSGDLTFSRSNDTATRVNSDGLIEKVRTNLFLRSEEFDNAYWNKINTTVTANTSISPDGNTNAETFTINSGSTQGEVSKSLTTVTGASYVFSCFGKKGSGPTDLNSFRVVGVGIINTVTINWDTGVISQTGSGATSENFGNGWYRIIIPFVANSTTTIAQLVTYQIYPSSVFSYRYGAQLETGDIATDYIATTTAAVSVGPVANLPRLDYLDSSCPKLLLEPQRTNLLTYSEQFDNAAWVKNNTTISANFATSPSGYQDADKIIPSTSNTSHNVDRFSIGVSSNGTASVFLKSSGYTKAAIRSYFTGGFASFDLVNGAVLTSSGVTAKIENYGNGWYRCSVNDTGNALYGYVLAVLDTSNDPNDAYVGDGTSGVLAWGAQLEIGAYATSYIPALSAASTRGADSTYEESSSALIGQTEGTLFAQFKGAPSGSGGASRISISSGTTNDWIFVGTESTALRGFIRANSSTIFSDTTILASGNDKIALAYKSGSMVLYINGVQILASSTAFTFSATLDDISTGVAGSYSVDDTLALSQMLIFPTRLSNAELEALTTL